MSFFQCSRCDVVEDTALCHYWSARLQTMPVLCSACDPKIARWHGQFPREPARQWISGQRGLICRRSEVEDWLGRSVGQA